MIKKENIKSEKIEKAEKPQKNQKKKMKRISTILEVNDKKISIKDVERKVSAEAEKIFPKSEIETIEIYMNVSEQMAYFVINGHASSDYKIPLA